MIGGIILLAIVITAAFVLWPRDPNLSIGQFAKLVDKGAIGGHLVAGKEYVDAPPELPTADPDGLASCEVRLAFGRKHVLRVWSGNTAEDVNLWVELWDSGESIKTAYDLEAACETDRADLKSSTYGARLQRVYLRTQGSITRSFSRGIENVGVAGFTAATANVRAGGMCGSGCGTETFVGDFASKFDSDFRVAREG